MTPLLNKWDIDLRVVNIMGAGHCGSTVLEILLNTHPSIVGVGELGSTNLNQSRKCSCGQEVVRCRVWSNVDFGGYKKLEVFLTPLSFIFCRNLFYDHNGFMNKKELLRKVRYQESVYRDIGRISGKEIICDSTKNPYYAMAQYKFLDSEKVVIHIIRDPRANIWSYYKKYGKFWRYVYAWLANNIKAFALSFLCSKASYIIVDYDDLCHNTDSVLGLLSRKLKIDNSFSINSLSEVERHQIKGNRLRKIKDLVLKSDDKWRKEMPLYMKIMVSPLLINYYFFKLSGEAISWKSP